MKKSVSVFILLLLVIALLVVTACFGIKDIGLKSVFDEDGVRMGLDLVGGSSITLEAVEELTQPETTAPVEGEDAETETEVAEPAGITADTINSVIAVLNQRVTTAGYTEATVTEIQGKNRVRVDIPSVADPEDAIELLGATAQLMFLDSEFNLVLTGEQVKSAKMDVITSPTGASQTVVALEFDNSARASFADATERMAAKPEGQNIIYIALDDSIISAPAVKEKIDSTECVIQGDFTAEEATRIANLISSGNLPCKLDVVETRSVGATLGAEALSRALKAGAIGIILVMLFMIIMYQLPGFISAIALIGYIAITAICIVGFKINLSLPGIAGIFLTIGMAVDANVIIFERIREELNGGKSVRAAVQSGFNRAFSAILDSNITTIIAALVLWKFGTGAIQGFAITLFLGVVISLISALFLTKLFLNSLVGMGVTNIKLFGAKYADNN